MKKLPPVLILMITLCFCNQAKQAVQPAIEAEAGSIIVDSTFADSARKNMQFSQSKFLSSFKTHLDAQFYDDGILKDSINENDWEMMSWYSINRDTIDLVAHIQVLQSEAMLLRFVNGQTIVRLFRAPHDTEHKYFKIKKGDSLSNQIEVPPVYYRLKLSQIPDTLTKPVVYGHIDMESEDYFDSRDSIAQKHRIRMKFYFRSQYRKFDFQ